MLRLDVLICLFHLTVIGVFRIKRRRVSIVCFPSKVFFGRCFVICVLSFFFCYTFPMWWRGFGAGHNRPE
jgi:hypothetical protein